MLENTSKAKAYRPSGYGLISAIEAKKKNRKNPLGEALLSERLRNGLDLWTGEVLSNEDTEALLCSMEGLQEKPPISEAKLTIEGLKEAKKQGRESYQSLCDDLDDYLEGGRIERQRFEKLAGTSN